MNSEILDDIMFGISNGLAQNEAWQEPLRNNEIMFQLPKGFNVGNTIVIKGQLNLNQERLQIGLTRGTENSSKNFLFYIIFDFVQDEVRIVRDENGLLVVDQKVTELSDLCPDSDFIFHIKFKENSQNEFLLSTMLGAYAFDDVNLLQYSTEILNNQENIFITVQEDTLKIQELKFLW